ncbi:TldD/PmbA family protein [Aquabacterium sp.]|uniref:TldD/PmbA family protein n=1 Tax=Aquabacterium sp. TaxID=1872578 RepID=UPI003D6D1BD4
MFDELESHARQAAPAGIDHWAVRGVSERSQRLLVRQNIAQSPSVTRDEGAMVTVIAGGGLGYAATSDTSAAGLKVAFARAQALARATAGRTVFDPGSLRMPSPQGRYDSEVIRDSAQMSLSDRIELLRAVSAATKVDDRIIDWQASLWTVHADQLHLTSDGARAEQHWQMLTPAIQATAQAHGVTQTRSSAGQYNGFCQQGGLEVIDRSGFRTDGPRVAQEAIELTLAPPCPSGTLDLVLMPDQMMLQIHESIGHPLELDRILGDERNFAGTSFVTLDMFGHYRYGSDLLNVSHDPQQAHEFAGFAFDDDGTGAQRQRIIEHGILQQPLGGAISQSRARALGFDLGGLATTRASSWNRAPIDRMSNLNVEPGDARFDQIIASIEHGVLMRTNCSWSIDDSRNKFQFGCEHGRMIRHGQLAEVVRNPNYRGISATFWRSLAMVGDASTFEVMGTPFCGKGEPSQVIRVGHAAPVCKFADVAVFGGA